MPTLHRKIFGASALALLMLAGCDNASEDRREASQTQFPGQVSSGGGTGGEVMAKNGTLQAKPDRMGSPVMVPVKAAESQPSARPDTAPRGAAENSGAAGTGSEQPKGTPGIPEGSGGNTSGAEMGGSTPGAAASKQQDPASKPAGPEEGKAKKEAETKAQADMQKQQLEASMNAVVQRWKAIASARGWNMESGGETESSGTSEMGQTATSAIGLPAVIRSEKLGTAPPSEDVKDPSSEPSK